MSIILFLSSEGISLKDVCQDCPYFSRKIDLEKGSQVEAVEVGPQVSEQSLSELLKLLQAQLPHAELVVLSGSLPPGSMAAAPT